MSRDKVLINHIFEFISKIERYTEGVAKEEFLSNFLIQDAVTRNIETIGEACSRISKETKEKFPEIPWRDIVAMRNMLIHEYFRADPETIWNVVQSNIPELKIQASKILKSLL